jgi:ornithine cyclodeaminase
MEVLVLTEEEIRSLISSADAFDACRDGLIKLARGEVVQPDVMSFDLREQKGEIHAKGAHILGAPYFGIKVASSFYENPRRGLPVMSGAVWVFDATSGFLRAMLLDNSYLTNLRTGVAGGIAANLLARPSVKGAAILGCGVQGRFQLDALLQVRRPELVVVWGRNADAARAYAEEMAETHRVPVQVAPDARSAVEGADVIITTTPAREPIVKSEWVREGAHITAVGSDMPGKQELDAALLGRSKVVADRLEQCVTQGEIQHALKAGIMRVEDVYAELGEIAAGIKPGRTADDEITICDMTGVGVLDAAVANQVTKRALDEGVGRNLLM